MWSLDLQLTRRRSLDSLETTHIPRHRKIVTSIDAIVESIQHTQFLITVRYRSVFKLRKMEIPVHIKSATSLIRAHLHAILVPIYLKKRRKEIYKNKNGSVVLRCVPKSIFIPCVNVPIRIWYRNNVEILPAIQNPEVNQLSLSSRRI